MRYTPNGPEIEMTPDGQFREPNRDPNRAPTGMRLGAFAVLGLSMAFGLAILAVTIWLAVILVPFVLAIAVCGALLLRFQAWRARRSFSGGGNIRRF